MPRHSKYEVSLQDGFIRVLDKVSENEEVLSLSDLAVVGESTDQNGPYVEDWHLCLGDRSDWTEIPVSALGFETFLEELSLKLGFPPKLKLGNSADFKSRVMWPLTLADKPLFSYRKKLFGLSVHQEYSPEVWTFLSDG